MGDPPHLLGNLAPALVVGPSFVTSDRRAAGLGALDPVAHAFLHTERPGKGTRATSSDRLAAAVHEVC